MLTVHGSCQGGSSARRRKERPAAPYEPRMEWSCDSCGRTVVTNPLLCDLCGAGAAGADPAKVDAANRRDLHMEAHLRGLSIVQRGGAVAMALLCVFALMTALSLRGALGGAVAGFLAWQAERRH